MEFQKIGRGLQYTVYDLGNGRVRKIPNGFFRRFRIVYYSKSRREMTFLRRFSASFHDAYDTSRVTNNSIQLLKERHPKLPLVMLGNPVFFSGLGYEQDFVRPLENFLEQGSVERDKEIILKYIDTIHEMWRYGFCDMVFNFTINNGLREDGSVVQLDLGELTSLVRKIEERIKNKKWLMQASFRRLQRDETRDFFVRSMEERITLERFRALWNTA